MLLDGFEPTTNRGLCTMAHGNVFMRFVGGQVEVINQHGETVTCGEIGDVTVNDQLATINLRWNARPIGKLTENRWEVCGNNTLRINLRNQTITVTRIAHTYASQGMRMVFHHKDHPRCNPSSVAGLTPA
jgi:hypothetical protein